MEQKLSKIYCCHIDFRMRQYQNFEHDWTEIRDCKGKENYVVSGGTPLDFVNSRNGLSSHEDIPFRGPNKGWYRRQSAGVQYWLSYIYIFVNLKRLLQGLMSEGPLNKTFGICLSKREPFHRRGRLRQSSNLSRSELNKEWLSQNDFSFSSGTCDCKT